MTKPAYKRVLLKLSGEALMGDDAFGINRATIERMVADVAEVSRMGVRIGDRDRWRQYLPWRSARCARVWTVQQLIIWVCWQPS